MTPPRQTGLLGADKLRVLQALRGIDDPQVTPRLTACLVCPELLVWRPQRLSCGLMDGEPEDCACQEFLKGLSGYGRGCPLRLWPEGEARTTGGTPVPQEPKEPVPQEVRQPAPQESPPKLMTENR